MSKRRGFTVHEDERRRLLEEIDEEIRLTEILTGIGALSPPVRRAVARVPRHRFVPAAERPLAYLNQPLPIGHGQTVSQPYIVALMTELLRPKAGDRVLEVGTGCGYQTAVLAEIVSRVYTIEVIEDLARSARERLLGLGYENIEFRTGDGRAGWPEAAPFDGALVTAAADEVPAALCEQLAEGGRLVIPLAQESGGQTLELVVRSETGGIKRRPVLPVSFVALRGRP